MSIVPSFSDPWVLLFILLMPVLLWSWHRRRGPALSYSSLSLVSTAPSPRARWSRRGGVVFRAIGLTILLIALAGPRWPDPGSRIPTQGIAIMLVVDVSDSMATVDFMHDDKPVRRLDAVKQVFRTLVQGGDGLPGRANDLIGLVTFATFPQTACPLTMDHAALLRLLDAEEPRSLATTPGEHLSNPGDGIAWALHRLQSAPVKRKAIVFLSDGESNVPAPALRPRQAAQLARNVNVPIYAIDASRSENDPKQSEAKARETLQALAALSNGEYFKADSLDELSQACKEIDNLERTTIPSLEYRRYYSGVLWFGLIAFVFLVAVHALEATVWRKAP